MNKQLLVTLFLSLGLCGQPIQAASYYETLCCAAAASVTAAGIGYITNVHTAQKRDQRLKDNEKLCTVTDQDLIKLIHIEAVKRGLNPDQIKITQNVRSISAYATYANIRSFFTQGGHEFSVGKDLSSEPYFECSTEHLSHYSPQFQIPVIQHELNHIKYHHQAKQSALRCCTGALTTFITYCAIILAKDMISSKLSMDAGPHWLKVSFDTFFPAAVASLPFYLLAPVFERFCFNPFSRYCERQADLAIDNNPKIIKNMIKYLHSHYDDLLVSMGKELADNYLYENASHPHPLERIAYLTEKLNRVLEKQKQEHA